MLKLDISCKLSWLVSQWWPGEDVFAGVWIGCRPKLSDDDSVLRHCSNVRVSSDKPAGTSHFFNGWKSNVYCHCSPSQRSSLTSCSRSPARPSGQTCGLEPVHQTGGGKVGLPPQKDPAPSWAGCHSAMLVERLQEDKQHWTRALGIILKVFFELPKTSSVISCFKGWMK